MLLQTRWRSDFTDGASAYKGITNHGFHHEYVSHQDGEYFQDEKIRGKLYSVNTNGIGGLWGRYTTWIANKFGLMRHQIGWYLKEYQWRLNHASEDLFGLMLSYMACK